MAYLQSVDGRKPDGARNGKEMECALPMIHADFPPSAQNLTTLESFYHVLM